jgi:hypothetical protein
VENFGKIETGKPGKNKVKNICRLWLKLNYELKVQD